MDNESVSFERVNYLLTLGITSANLSKRMYRTKDKYNKEGVDTETKKKLHKEYLALSLVKAITFIEG